MLKKSFTGLVIGFSFMSYSDLMNDLPGWLYETNGVLHPRCSEYDVQYVVDGMPLTQNRSPAFSPSFEPSEVESLRVLTAISFAQ